MFGSLQRGFKLKMHLYLNINALIYHYFPKYYFALIKSISKSKGALAGIKPLGLLP